MYGTLVVDCKARELEKYRANDVGTAQEFGKMETKFSAERKRLLNVEAKLIPQIESLKRKQVALETLIADLQGHLKRDKKALEDAEDDSTPPRTWTLEEEEE
jgi:hypothetical protein